MPTPPFVDIPFEYLMKGPTLWNEGELTDEDMSTLNIMVEDIMFGTEWIGLMEEKMLHNKEKATSL